MVDTSPVDGIGQPNAASPVHPPLRTGWRDLEHRCRLSSQVPKHGVLISSFIVISGIKTIRSERVCCYYDGSDGKEKSEKRFGPSRPFVAIGNPGETGLVSRRA